jgi:hypothetical protein
MKFATHPCLPAGRRQAGYPLPLGGCVVIAALAEETVGFEAPRPQGGASRKGNFVDIVPLNPAYKPGLAGHVPAKALECGLLGIANRCSRENGIISRTFNV